MTHNENNNFTSSLSESIREELTLLLNEIKDEARKKTTISKYIQKILNAFQDGNVISLNKLLKDKSKTQLLTFYPSAKDTFDKLMIDIRRRSERSFTDLIEKVRDYCSVNGVSLKGNMPKLIVDNLLEIYFDEKNKTAKIGAVFVKDAIWEKIRPVLEREHKRIWKREFSPSAFRDKLVNTYKEIIGIKPNPLGWVRLEDIYRSLKVQIKSENLVLKKSERLIAYYKDEFSSDLSKLWEAQMNKKVEYPHLEFSAIRDPRLAYKFILPDGQVISYGHMRLLEKER